MIEAPVPVGTRPASGLRNADVVDSRRRGTWVYYRLAEERDPVRSGILKAVLDGVREDRARLAVGRAGVSCE